MTQFGSFPWKEGVKLRGFTGGCSDGRWLGSRAKSTYRGQKIGTAIAGIETQFRQSQNLVTWREVSSIAPFPARRCLQARLKKRRTGKS